MLNSRKVYVISHTHWDREWYRTYQEFRLLLVRMMDRLIDLMKHQPDFKYFLLDGQSVILEDYLSVRPERATDVRELVRAGRIGVGPWYVQPDEFLVSGEALIRNLLLGHCVANDMGDVAKVGWLPDTFGHIAQLPQILRNFGIDNFIFSRGLGNHLQRLVTEFFWEAPNGDRVLALFQASGYWNAGNLGYPFFWGDTSGREPDYELAVRQVKEAIARLEPLSATSAIPLWNGADHTPPVESLPSIVSHVDAHLPGYQVQHGSIADLVRTIAADSLSLQVVRGELRGSHYQGLPLGVLSTRMYLKQANHRVQRLLERYAEPISACAWLSGAAYPSAQLWQAWRLLLQNHAHDSICGCSIDQVHREMMGRFDQSRQIGEQLLIHSMDHLAAQIDTKWCASDGVPVLVFNPTSQPRREVVSVAIKVPQVAQGYRAVDSQGSASDVQVCACTEKAYEWLPQHTSAVDFLSNLAWWRECLRDIDTVDIHSFSWEEQNGQVLLHLGLGDWQRGSDQVLERLREVVAGLPPDAQLEVAAHYYEVALLFQADVPPFGYALYSLEPLGTGGARPSAVTATQTSLENEAVQIWVRADGGLTVVDKASGIRLDDVHQFEDSADLGDLYDFCPPPVSEGADTLRSVPRVELVERGGLRSTLRLSYRFHLPACLANDRRSRSEERVEMEVVTDVRLRAGDRYLEFLTTVENRARDHRLRVVFPCNVRADVVYSGGHFVTTKRPLQLPDATDWMQPPSPTQPHQVWFAVHDPQTVVAVLSEGLPEHEVSLQESGATMALTLLRCVGDLSRQDLTNRKGQSGPVRATPGAQCIGRHQFRYGLLLQDGSGLTAVSRIAEQFDVPLIAHPARLHTAGLPARATIIELAPAELTLTAVKCNDAVTDLVVRFFNAGDAETVAHVRFGFPVAAVWRATMAEEPVAPLGVAQDGRADAFPVKPGEITTLLVRPKASLVG